jgi:putative FmdB family regulatory protein
MPIYEYQCQAHGLFEQMRPMQRSSEGADCPTCSTLAPRVLSATRTNVVPRALSIAHGRNEKSRHSPEVCTHVHSQPARAPAQPPRLQAYRGKRPWVMEHG